MIRNDNDTVDDNKNRYNLQGWIVYPTLSKVAIAARATEILSLNCFFFSVLPLATHQREDSDVGWLVEENIKFSGQLMEDTLNKQDVMLMGFSAGITLDSLFSFLVVIE